MQAHVNSVTVSSILIATLTSLAVGCATGERTVQLADLSEPARATVTRVTADGSIESLLKEMERGRWVYDVEATVGGRHVEYTIADSNGEILGTETQMEYADLPESIQ